MTRPATPRTMRTTPSNIILRIAFHPVGSPKITEGPGQGSARAPRTIVLFARRHEPDVDARTLSGRKGFPLFVPWAHSDPSARICSALGHRDCRRGRRDTDWHNAGGRRSLRPSSDRTG